MPDALFELSLKVLFYAHGQALALQRHSYQGDLFWDLPGGRLKANEQPHQVLTRELSAEINLKEVPTFKDFEIFDFNLWSDPAYSGSPKGIVYYRAQLALDPTRLQLSSEHAGAALLSMKDLQNPAEVIKGARMEKDFRAVLTKGLS